MPAKSSDDETLRMPAVTDPDNGAETAESMEGTAGIASAAGNAAKEPSQSVADAVKSANEAHASMANDEAIAQVATKQSRWKRFKHWRKRRPFAGGLLLILSGIAIAAPAYITVRISDLLVMISTVSGVSTLLIGVALIMFGLGSWFRQETSTYLGVLGILVAIIALPTSNLGGFLIGSLLGIIGGALAFAWQPQVRQKVSNKKKSEAKEVTVSA
ncbi:DUF6114 domain-containing protein [Corynebacterium accolens]|uniref:DUF6114 domain-containing protein n=2 Tax=Corynebacterium accolens TaxID=38284 RepID=A0ABT7FLQ7_9CORY|nr:DUF6114 domain-containing protein [Corynebacterium accolens]MDK4246521.1 DUF6114 domain-containing protein [Corynebacterium accolens]MDK8681887.1 DUF6114 domain-containing protein [Corynebacterium accolens]WKS68034.1 DUF6114 domain-containing protein [Corynebacterium accolens]WKS72238.1 DUF6114 domain-containing protein [Corynebacterium accolens]WKS72558.1 DUF6114 domain-containing protein [Corynebacterium accolens]